MIYTSGTTGRPKGVKRARQTNVAAAMDFPGQYGSSVGLDGAGPPLHTRPQSLPRPPTVALSRNRPGPPDALPLAWGPFGTQGRAHGPAHAALCLEERQAFPTIDERLDTVELDRAREIVVRLPAQATLDLGLESG